MRFGPGGIAFTYQTFNLLKVAGVCFDEMRYYECLWCGRGTCVCLCVVMHVVWVCDFLFFYFQIKS